MPLKYLFIIVTVLIAAGCKVRDVSVSQTHACAIQPKTISLPGDRKSVINRLVCWGDDAPEPPQGSLTPKDVATASFQTCLIHSVTQEDNTKRNELSCWGNGPIVYDFEDWNFERYGAPSRIATSETQACGVFDDDKDLRCWGKGVVAPNILAADNVVDFAVGNDHVCAIIQDPDSPRKVRCWRAREYDSPWITGWYWDETDDRISNIPDSITNPSDIAVTNYHSCVVQNRELICWGSNLTISDELQAKIDQYGVDSISSSKTRICMTINGTVECVGQYIQYQPESFSEAAVDIVSLTEYFACGMTLEDKVVCWGDERFASH
ncbi:MAG: hypothetical protein R3208_19460, partial [Ketobacteraceae bacterium]|nr:hypothetical protein [Ketobacteraceae bacterium]